jgi:hypothetical protein
MSALRGHSSEVLPLTQVALAGESLDRKSISNSPSYVSAPTFNASATRACVTSLATLKSDSWASDVTWNFVAVALGMVAFGLFALPPLIRRSGYE